MLVQFQKEENQVLHEQLPGARQQQAVAELGARALSGADLQSLFDETVAAVSRTLQAEFATFLELQSDGREFVLKAGYGWRPELIGEVRIPANSQFLGGYALASDKPVFVENVWTESRFQPHPLVAAHSITSEMGSVISGRPRPRGVLCVHSTRSRTFQDDDALFLQAAANTLAAAIDRRRAEEELKRFVEPSLNPMFVGSFDGTLKDCNHATESLTGYSRDEMRGRPIAAFVHPDDRQTVAAEIIKVATGESAQSFSVRIVAKNGSTKWTIWNATSFPEWEELYATGQDVTEQHLAEEELRASEEMLEATDNSALDGTVLLDADGNVVHWNAAAEKIFGYRGEEIRGRSLHHTLVPPEMREKFEQGWRHFQQTGAGPVIGKVLELEALRKDGARFPVEVSVAAVSLHGRWNAVGVIRDITTRKQQEAELIAAKQAAEAANRAKSDFLANMSHEIRTPMNGVIGLTSLVLDTELSAEQRQYLDGVMLSAEALLKIINDILDFSKIEAGRLELERVDFDLREAVGNTMQTLALRAHQKNLELTYDVRPEAPDALVGDPARLWQVIVNLVGNAVKFTDQGEVSLSVAVEALQEHAVCLHFTVSDTGIGIPADKQKTLFKPFSQVDTSMSRKYGGSGLGLAISAQIVEMMKGRIWFESELGKGSTFHFTAWFDRRTTPLAKRAPLPPSALDNLRVLVVDDNATNRMILRDMLTHWGMRPAEADRGEVALESLAAAFQAADPFGLILLDGTDQNIQRSDRRLRTCTKLFRPGPGRNDPIRSFARRRRDAVGDGFLFEESLDYGRAG
jgi:PAS domain S-box-containing protein